MFNFGFQIIFFMIHLIKLVILNNFIIFVQSITNYFLKYKIIVAL